MYKMKSYCLKCRRDTENINPKVSNNSNGKTMTLSECAICGSKKSRFIKNQEAMQYVVVKNQDLLKIKKQKDY